MTTILKIARNIETGHKLKPIQRRKVGTVPSFVNVRSVAGLNM